MSGDPGLFGPDSLTWRIHGDPSMAPAGLRALLLQAVHPLAMAGVAAASSFREDPWGRLLRTADYVATVSYGTTAEAERIAARVRGLHRRAGGGIEPDSGQAFRVDDPDLLRWVHVTEVESFLTTYRRCGGRLEPGEADVYLTEQRRAAALVGVDPATVPGDEASMADYFAEIRPQLQVTREARRAAQFILLPPMPRKVGLTTPAKPAWAGMAGLAFAMLPAWVRRLYRLPGLPTTDLGASLSGRALRTALLAVPPQLREGPALKAARARVVRGRTGSPPNCPRPPPAETDLRSGARPGVPVPIQPRHGRHWGTCSAAECNDVGGESWPSRPQASS